VTCCNAAADFAAGLRGESSFNGGQAGPPILTRPFPEQAMYGGSSTSQGGAAPESEPAAKPSDPVPVPAAAATAKTPEGGEHDAGAGAAEAGAEPSPKRPRSWQELSQSLIEGMTGAMRAAKEGVASMIMAMAEADPFSEVSATRSRRGRQFPLTFFPDGACACGPCENWQKWIDE